MIGGGGPRYRAPDGRERSKTFPTRREAERWLAMTTASIVVGTYAAPERSKQPFVSFAREWADAQDWKATTRESFPHALARLERVLPDRVALGAIDQLAIKRARVDLARAYATATVDLTVGYLVAIMRAAYVSGRIPRDPTVGAQVSATACGRRREGRPRGRADARGKVAAIWQAAPSAYRAAIALGATGLRVGEVLGMSADRIDLEQRLVTIDRQLQRVGGALVLTTPKCEKARTIRVPSAVAVELRRHFREYRADGLLFAGARTGAPMRRDQFYASAWRPALRGAGLAENRFVFHALRHFAASSMLAEGVNPMAVAGHLGDTLETLQRTYAHWMRDDHDVPAEALEHILATKAPALDAVAGSHR
ncbi:MAG: hypothetical protein KatS3mg010_0950 [Acidimicrobiia bacterium]|nr:MAG: hypothetical protein KatS3mg010_0950 [Acidimicrobiia bacterium]